MTAILCSLFLLAQSTPQGKADTAQRGSTAATARSEDRTAIPGAGIAVGVANGLEGGRTDEGPFGGTGIRNVDNPLAARARANAYDQLRGPNNPGSFLRPADTPPQMNTNPVPIGSGAPSMPVDEHD